MITFMKKSLCYILAILCFAGTWSSCSDDGGDDGKEPLTAPEVSLIRQMQACSGSWMGRKCHLIQFSSFHP